MNIPPIKSKKIIALNLENLDEYEFLKQDKRKIQFDGKQLDVELERTPDGFSMLRVGDVRYPVEIVSRNQNVYEILVNGVSYNLSVESPFSLERRKVLADKAAESSVILLKAPMPGKIIDVLVTAGDTVKAGDTLVILEAMKMQNAIMASSRAIVKKVLVKVGDATSKSDLLIELEKE
jgi:propionyl-CoA carboxylase alpha chain